VSTVAQGLQKLWEHNLQLIPSRKVRVQQVGSHYKAFFDGDGRSVTFGETPTEATKRLKFWEKYKHA
jgi:hypothetical protein